MEHTRKRTRSLLETGSLDQCQPFKAKRMRRTVHVDLTDGTDDEHGKHDNHNDDTDVVVAAATAADKMRQIREDEKLARALQAMGEYFAVATNDHHVPDAPARARFDETTTVDILKEHRENIRHRLTIMASGLKIVSIQENPHAKVGTKLYNRFAEAWRNVQDKSVRLAFHGTPESNIDSICEHGLDPTKRCTQARGPGEYFSKIARGSVSYCDGGKKMLVVALLLDKSGLTADAGHVVVIHKPEHQLPLFVITFDMALFSTSDMPLGSSRALPISSSRPFSFASTTQPTVPLFQAPSSGQQSVSSLLSKIHVSMSPSNGARQSQKSMRSQPSSSHAAPHLTRDATTAGASQGWRRMFGGSRALALPVTDGLDSLQSFPNQSHPPRGSVGASQSRRTLQPPPTMLPLLARPPTETWQAMSFRLRAPSFRAPPRL